MVKGGLDAYVSYPMTPSSTLLHFLAEHQEKFGITVVHPENEIAVILMALGFAYAGKRSGVGTSGGGFCLMTEGLSLAGMAELPLVLVVSQRTGPSTGLPTYTGQSGSPVHHPCRTGGVSPAHRSSRRCAGSTVLVRNRHEYGMEISDSRVHPYR